MTIAIIKTGATGDVIRTSVLLRLFHNAEITWITTSMNRAVLPTAQSNLKRVVAIESKAELAQIRETFDLVISLDDDTQCAQLASQLCTKALFGAYLYNGKVVYTDDAAEWFDMGLSSRLGKQRADELKWENMDSYQTILFRMLGYTFKDEEYVLPESIDIINHNVIGIEARAGARWPTKIWHRYEKLAHELTKQGHTVMFFEERPSILAYMQDIGNCRLLIGGDSLGMHVALGLKIPVVTLFTCTSAVEIHGYDRMEKVISPNLKQAFYKTAYVPEAVESIQMDDVLAAVNALEKRSVTNSDVKLI